MKNLNSYINESIIGSNNAGVFSEEVFNRIVREKFEDAFKNLVNFKHMYKDPLEYSDMGASWILGWAITINKSGEDIEKEFLKNIEKFTNTIKQYKPKSIDCGNDYFEEGIIKAFEINLQSYPEDSWGGEPSFNVAFAKDIDEITHSKYWLLIEYDDIGMDDIFNQKK